MTKKIYSWPVTPSGAGIGEMVLVTTDETTQHAVDRPAPIDAFIVGIVDSEPIMGK